MEQLFAAYMCLLGVTTLISVLLCGRVPQLWRHARAVIGAAVIVLLLTVRLALHTPSSFDAVADGFEVVPTIILTALVGLFHAGLFVCLIGAAVITNKPSRK